MITQNPCKGTNKQAKCKINSNLFSFSSEKQCQSLAIIYITYKDTISFHRSQR